MECWPLSTTIERDWTRLTFSVFICLCYLYYRCIKFTFIGEQTLTKNWIFVVLCGRISSFIFFWFVVYIIDPFLMNVGILFLLIWLLASLCMWCGRESSWVPRRLSSFLSRTFYLQPVMHKVFVFLCMCGCVHM